MVPTLKHWMMGIHCWAKMSKGEMVSVKVPGTILRFDAGCRSQKSPAESWFAFAVILPPPEILALPSPKT